MATDRSSVQSLGVELGLLVHVIDENNHGPVFSRDRYEVEVSEATSVPRTLIRLEASDQDAGDYGRVTYESVHGLLESR